MTHASLRQEAYAVIATLVTGAVLVTAVVTTLPAVISYEAEPPGLYKWFLAVGMLAQIVLLILLALCVIDRYQCPSWLYWLAGIVDVVMTIATLLMA
ncbi:hypothetical protein [Nonomuraea sp. NPDC049141]|uniref:hypothetical protein n=1 Tax=Nonomuraea sp. NPDC049141 TaxID=3155500 RepID=UPI0033FC45E8